MRNFKMLVTDIDDTLLNSNHELSAENLAAIHALHENKHFFVLASGRPDGGMKQIVETTGLDTKDGYIIAYNGGKIINVETGNVLFETGLEHHHFAEVSKFAAEHDLSLCSYTETAVVVNRESEQSRIEASLTGLDYIVSEDIVSYFQDKLIPKSIIFGPEEKIAEMRPKLIERVGTELEVVISKPIFLEVTPKGIHKGSAVRQLASLLEIDIADVIAVGDGENDLEMIKAAGHGIAVDNAANILKDAADEVCVTNDEHAIAYVVDKYFLGN